MKRIVICADGTWNKPEKKWRNDRPTNVLKIARAIKPLAKDDDGRDVHQVVFYDWGVGSYHDELTGGAFGAGLNKNIQDCYRFIVQNYAPGDQLFLFGFSRGAYTVRSLSGLLNNVGILKRSRAARIHEAFELYRSAGFAPGSPEAQRYRKRHSVDDRGSVRFLGAFDTVGSLGVPINFLKVLNGKYEFHDRKLGHNVRYARHAVSIDEKRDDFFPTMMQKGRAKSLMQVWFVGGHSDVGGGYARNKNRLLSDDPLRWMAGEATKAGLQFEKHLVRGGDNDHLAPIHDEYKGAMALLGTRIRVIPSSATMHRGVVHRYKARKSYRPLSLKRYLTKTQNHWPKMA